ncbi:MAG TPA: hypothetical protein PK167_11610, partial [Prolixibacteraceae bacterium]|nr:hypothetical protein [Prolixibacteraceae bacterium]
MRQPALFFGKAVRLSVFCCRRWFGRRYHREVIDALSLPELPVFPQMRLLAPSFVLQLFSRLLD